MSDYDYVFQLLSCDTGEKVWLNFEADILGSKSHEAQRFQGLI